MVYLTTELAYATPIICKLVPEMLEYSINMSFKNNYMQEAKLQKNI